MSDEKNEDIQLPTEAELTQAIRLVNQGSGVIYQLCDMLDALHEGRLVINSYEGHNTGYDSTPYKGIKIRKKK